MKDLIITICHDTRKVKYNRGFIGLTGENLQGNIVVDFQNKSDFINGNARLEVVQKGVKYFLELTKNITDKTYSLPIKSSLLSQDCSMDCQIVIQQEATANGEIPIFKSQIFKLPCHSSINATETIPEQYPSWVDQVNEKLDNLEKGGTGSGNAYFKSYEAYQTAYNQGKVPVGTLVIIDENSGGGDDSGATSAILGQGQLGYMILE